MWLYLVKHQHKQWLYLFIYLFTFYLFIKDCSVFVVVLSTYIVRQSITCFKRQCVYKYLDCLFSHGWDSVTKTQSNMWKDLLINSWWLQVLHKVIKLKQTLFSFSAAWMCNKFTCYSCATKKWQLQVRNSRIQRLKLNIFLNLNFRG